MKKINAIDKVLNATETGSADIHCPSCGGARLVDVFDMQNLPGNVCILLDTPESAQSATCGDVTLSYCQHCGFVYNRIFELSRVGYAPGYDASLIHSRVFREYITGVAWRLIERYDLHNKTIVEIGCGHGEFLKLICELGQNRGIGIDPSIPDALLSDSGHTDIQFIREYYSEKHAGIEADFICCLSVFEHIPNPADFLKMLRRNIGDHHTGIYFEVYNAWMAFKDRQTWSIHYEQCNYYSPVSYPALFERCGFKVAECATSYANDQYLYVEAFPDTPADAKIEAPAKKPLPAAVAQFSRVHRERMAYWRKTFAGFASAKTKVAVWGSGGKGMSFLNALDSRELIHYVVDINPNRQGKYIPGSAQQVVAPEFLTGYQPDVIIITNPLYQSEIKIQVAELGVECEFLVA